MKRMQGVESRFCMLCSFSPSSSSCHLLRLSKQSSEMDELPEFAPFNRCAALSSSLSLILSSPSDTSFRKSQIYSTASFLIGRISVGLLAAAYVFLVLIILLSGSAFLAVWIVRSGVEEPIRLQEPLQFNYAEVCPSAVAIVGEVPVGQTIHAHIVVVMPESEYNRELGMFQVNSEIISNGGETVAKSSQPYLLKFTSWPIRAVRTFLIGVPLLLEITSETQLVEFSILKHKEGRYPRTEAIRVTLVPRSGTSFLPQIYKADLVMESRLPWSKHLIYMWKWTLYIWATFYVFLLSVMLFFKPLIFPVITLRPGNHDLVMRKHSSSPPPPAGATKSAFSVTFTDQGLEFSESSSSCN